MKNTPLVMSTNTGRQLYRVAIIEDNKGEYDIFRRRIVDHDRLEFCRDLSCLLEGVVFREYVGAIARICFDVDIFIVDWDLNRGYAFEVLQRLKNQFQFDISSKYWIFCSKNDNNDMMADAVQGFFGNAINKSIVGKDQLKGNYSVPEKLNLASNLQWHTSPVSSDLFDSIMEGAIEYIKSISRSKAFDHIDLSGSTITLYDHDDTYYALNGDGKDELKTLTFDTSDFICFSGLNRVGVLIILNNQRQPKAYFFVARHSYDSLKELKQFVEPPGRGTTFYNPLYFGEYGKLKEEYRNTMQLVVSELGSFHRVREIPGSFWNEYKRDFSKPIQKVSLLLYKHGLLKTPLIKTEGE